MKIRVFKIATDIHLSADKVIVFLRQRGYQIESHMSILTSGMIEDIKEHFKEEIKKAEEFKKLVKEYRRKSGKELVQKEKIDSKSESLNLSVVEQTTKPSNEIRIIESHSNPHIKILKEVMAFNKVNAGYIGMLFGTYSGKHIITSRKILNKYKPIISITSSSSLPGTKNLVGLSFVTESDDINRDIYADTARYINNKLSQSRKSNLGR